MRIRPGFCLITAVVAPFAAVGPASAQAAADTAAAVRVPQWDWTTDRRRFDEGDIITVLIDEYTLASANKSSLAERDRSRDLSLDGGFSVAGGSGTDADAGLRSRVGAESRRRGQTTRRDRLTAEITVRVVAVEPNGNLRVEGRKTVVIDEHEQEIALTGLLRPDDVSPGNVVDSWRLADAEVSYTSNGELDDPEGGILGRILGWLWP